MPRERKITDPSKDRRGTSELDLIRATVWYEYIRRMGGLSTAYSVANSIDGNPDNKTKWKRYASGSGVPNQQTLEDAEARFPGSFDVFMCGPDRTKLWVALGSTEPEVLALICKPSDKTDGQIEQFKLDLIEGRIKMCPIGLMGSGSDILVEKRNTIHSALTELGLSGGVIARIMDKYITEFAIPYYDQPDEDLSRFINVDVLATIFARIRYQELEAGSIGRKGSGSAERCSNVDHRGVGISSSGPGSLGKYRSGVWA